MLKHLALSFDHKINDLIRCRYHLQDGVTVDYVTSSEPDAKHLFPNFFFVTAAL